MERLIYTRLVSEAFAARGCGGNPAPVFVEGELDEFGAWLLPALTADHWQWIRAMRTNWGRSMVPRDWQQEIADETGVTPEITRALVDGPRPVDALREIGLSCVGVTRGNKWGAAVPCGIVAPWARLAQAEWIHAGEDIPADVLCVNPRWARIRAEVVAWKI